MGKRVLHLAILPIVLLPAAPASAADHTDHSDAVAGQVVGVHLVSRVTGQDGPADDRPKRARSDHGITLYAVLAVDEHGRRVYYSDAGTIRLGEREHTTRLIAEAPPAVLLWYKVEPTVESMSNTASGKFRFEPIPYREVMVWEWMLAASATADVRPTLTPDRGDGVGTMRYKLVAYTAGGVWSTPGADARRGRGSGGLSDAVHRVSLRRDDSYLGVLTELYGQPYIWASAGVTDRSHQSERLEGSDCADFVVYGARRMGRAIPYTWTGGLDRYGRRLARGEPREDGVYVDSRGRPIPFPEPGDWIVFPRHVGALVADRGVPGVLDAADVMVHALFASPREQPITESGYAGTRVEVLRWRR